MFIQATISGEQKNSIQIVIRDTGIGIAKEFQNEIFQAFYQVDGTFSRSYGGAGLGLAISKEILELMEGTIELKSDLGVGTEFTIIFSPESVSSSKVISDSFEPELSNQIVVLIDDNESALDAVEQYLFSWGARVYRASTEAELMSILKSISGDCIDLILVDADMDIEFSIIKSLMKQGILRDSIIRTFNQTHRVQLDAGENILRKPISRGALAQLFET